MSSFLSHPFTPQTFFLSHFCAGAKNLALFTDLPKFFYSKGYTKIFNSHILIETRILENKFSEILVKHHSTSPIRHPIGKSYSRYCYDSNSSPSFPPPQHPQPIHCCDNWYMCGQWLFTTFRVPHVRSRRG